MSAQPEQINPASRHLAVQISNLQTRIHALEPIVRFTDLRRSIEDQDFDNTVKGLPETLKHLRTLGYEFERSLDRTSDELKEEWRTLHPQVRRQLEEQAAILRPELDSVVASMMQLTNFADDPIKAQTLLAHAQASVADLESRSKLAMAEISAPFTTYQTKVNELTATLQGIKQLLDRVAIAKFQLQPNEGALLAAPATWIRDREDHPEGFLYLTNQRVIFEQKQKVPTEKFLFITIESKLVEQILLDASVNIIVELRGIRKSGFLVDEDHVLVTFEAGDPVSEADFHIQGQNSGAWQELFARVKTDSLT